MIARQSTARTFMVGPVLDADGVAVTDGVIADMKISKNGGAPAAFDGSATLTHRHTGFYSLAATANDLDTVGTAQVTIDDTVNACPMLTIQVIEEAVYDRDYAASATGIIGTAQTGDSYAIVNSGTFGNAAIKTAVDLTATADKLLGYVQLICRDDTGLETDRSTELAEINADEGSGAGAYSSRNHSQENISSDINAIDVQGNCDLSLANIHLDHLIASADPGGVVANSSFLAKLVSKSATPAFASYDNTTDALEAQRDNVGTAGAGLTAADDAVITAIGAISTTIGVAGAGLTEAGGTGDHLTAIDLPNQTMDIVGNITGNLSGSVGSVTTKTGYALTAGEHTSIADATLKRAVSNVEADADKHSLALVVALATNASESGGTLTAKKPSDDTAWFTYTVTSDPAADPITEIS